MATRQWASGDPFPTVKDGDAVLMGPGPHAPFSVRNRRITVTGVGAAACWVEGNGKDGATVRGIDGCHGLTLRKFGARAADGAQHGFWVTVCDGLVMEDLAASGYEREAVLTGHCGRGVYRRLDLSGGTGDDHSHALYVSGRASGSVIEDCYLHDCPGSALQLNSASLGNNPETDRIKGAIVRRTRLARCGRGGDGTPLLSMMGASALLEDLLLEDPDNGLATAFDDEKGEEWNCRDLVFNRITVKGDPGFGVHLLAGSTVKSWGEWIGWAPDAGRLVVAFSDAPAAPTATVAAAMVTCPTCHGAGKVAAAA